jgi:nucleoside diphosphate kinase
MRKQTGTCGFALVSFLAIVFSMFKANIASAYVENSFKSSGYRVTEISQIHPGNVFFDLSTINSLIEDGEEIDELDDESEDDSFFHALVDFVPSQPVVILILHEKVAVETIAITQTKSASYSVPRFIRFRNLRI